MEKSSSNYAAAVIKPDAHRDVLAEMIIKDIEEAGISVIFKKDIVLSEEQAKKIYSEHIGVPHFDSSVKSLKGTEKDNFITFLIIKTAEAAALEKIQQIKGQSDKGGLRLKYRRFSREELEKKGYSDEKLIDELAKNRLHVPDSDEHCRQLINIFLTEKEKEELKTREPELYKELQKDLNENREINKEILLIPEKKMR